MVVLSAAIVTAGKTLVARQFVEMTRLRIEGLLSAFQKLVDSGRDHTFIETETVRYVYQPMEALHLLLVTNKSSNILEDLETLRLLAKVVQDCCQIQVNEELVRKHAFDIVFAFDEVISFGHRESVTLSQIKSYTEMDSHEEKLHQIIEANKINEAKETAKRKSMELKKARMDKSKDDKSSGFGGGGESPMPSSGPGFQDSMSSMSAGGSITHESSPPWSSSMADDSSSTAVIKPKSGPSKGMTLGKKRPGDALLGAVAGPAEPAEAAGEAAAKAEPVAAAPANPLLDPVRVDIEEKIAADLEVEGGLKDEATCTGQLQVTVLDASKADLACFKLNPQNQEYKYKLHPNLNKASYTNNILEVREASRAFRPNAPAPLLKWQMKSSKDEFLPITASCWPSATSDGTQIVLELELTDSSISLEDVRVRFSAPPSSRPSISSSDPGEAVYDAGTQQVIWQIPILDKSTSNGTLEFSASADSASLLPAVLEATRRGQTKCPMEVLECYHQERKDAISFACEKVSTYELKIG